MADFNEGFENTIRSMTAVTDIIGAGASCKVFPDMSDQRATGRFLVYAEGGGESEEHLTGSAGIAHTVMHVWAFGNNRKEANELAEVVRTGLRGQQNKKWLQHNVTEVSCSQHRETGVDAPQDKQPLPRYWTRRTFDIWHEEVT